MSVYKHTLANKILSNEVFDDCVQYAQKWIDLVYLSTKNRLKLHQIKEEIPKLNYFFPIK